MVWRNDQVSEGETAKILEVARECLAVEGDFVEMGCYKGDTSILLAEVLDEAKKRVTGVDLLRSGEDATEVGEIESSKVVTGVDNFAQKVIENEFSGKELWIYDSFEGLPEKGEEDASAMGVGFREGVLAVSKREVKARFLRSGLKVPRIVKGWFSDLAAEDLPEKIAFAFLDGDLYGSIRDCLKLVGPKMTAGGAILVHDYCNEALPGVAKAVDEWIDSGFWGEEKIEGTGVSLERFESLAIIGRE